MFRNRSKILALVASLMMAMGLQLVAALPASAAGTLTNVSFNLSKPHPGDTAVRYTWLFTAASTNTVATTTFTVPTGTLGASLTVTDVAGLPSGGTATLSSTTVTYTASGSVAAGTKCLIAIDGFTNGSAVTNFGSVVTTNTSVPAAIDSGTAANINLTAGSTNESVIIARSSAFSTTATSVALVLDPSVNTDVSASPLTLTMKSNAASGYTVNVKATALNDTDTPVNTISPLTAGVATATATFSTNRWGYNATKTGVGALQGAISATNYAGYTTAGENLIVAGAPTATDTVTITNRVKIDNLQNANTYSSTVTYTMGETY